MKTFRISLFLCLAFVAALSSFALADDLPELKFEKYELPNGLDVILHEDHSIPIVAVNVWYHVGSKNEKPGKSGFAHVFEHMMFQGSEHHNVLYDEGIDKIGGTSNGSTGEDATNYWENVPSNYLEKMLWMEADRMGYLLSAVDQKRLDIQRDVIKNERREGVDNQPYGKTDELLLSMLYPKNHPYSWSVIGSMEDLSAATLEDVFEFFKMYYAPNNASLCIAGDFNPAQAKEWVNRYFGPIPPGPAITRLTSWTPTLTEVKRQETEDNVSLARLYMVWNTPANYKPGDAEFDLLASILATGKSSRLYKSLIYDKQIAQDVNCFQNSMELNGNFYIIVTAKEGQSLDKIEQEVDLVLKDLLANGITADELERAKVNWEARFVRGLQRVGGFGGRADKLNSYNTYLGDPGELLWDRNRYSNATMTDIHNYAVKYLNLNGRAILRVYPRGQLSSSEEKTDMAVEPKAASNPPFVPPTMQKAALSNGMNLILVQDNRLPLVQMNILIKSGWAADPADRPGASAIAAELLNEGTKTKNTLQISEAFQRLGANLGTGSGRDNSSITLNVLKNNFDAALALTADIILNPTFPQDELDRQKGIYLGRIQQESRQPYTVAMKSYYKELYGIGHPYAQPYTGSGTVQSINAITRTDLEEYYNANYLPNNATAIIVGDITLDEAKSKLENAFKKWKPGTVVGRQIPTAKSIEKAKVCIVDKPGAAQSVIIVGNLVPPRNYPDYLAAVVATQALGGASTSRLFMNLRQDKGYTYGAYSFIAASRGQGALLAHAQVQTEVTAESISEFMKELRGIVGDRPISETELADSKDNLAKSYPQSFESLSGIAGQIGALVTYDLPDDEWATYMSRVNGIDAAAAAKAAREYIRPDEFLIMVVGDREKIERKIRELNLGEIINLPAE